MDARVESHGARSAKPSMFQAGLSTKFTKRHITNFHDTTLTAASAAKVRAELKIERQANAIEKQQQKIENEMKKIEAITEKLQRQQAREAKRLRNRLEFAASRIQIAFRSHITYIRTRRSAAAIDIQRLWRGHGDRQRLHRIQRQQAAQRADGAARMITRTVRRHACRLVRRHELAWREYAATTIQCAVRQHQAWRIRASLQRTHDETVRRHRAAVLIQSHTRGFLTRLVYMDVLYLVCRIQSVARGFLVRKRLRWLLSLNLRAIIALQALARGFLARHRVPQLREELRQRGRRQLVNSGASGLAVEETPTFVASRRRPVPPPQLIAAKDEARAGVTKRPSGSLPRDATRNSVYAIATLATMTSPISTSRQSPQRIKRSYWLPSGANMSSTAVAPSRRRLPQLPTTPKNPLASLDVVASRIDGTAAASSEVDVAVASPIGQLQRMARNKFGKHRPPQRLVPIDRLDGGCDNQRISLVTKDDEAESERRAMEERRMREDALKQKLAARKAHEKKRLELEATVRMEQQKEAAERRQMEREEKRTRLLVKTTRRKHHEIKLRRQTVEQQREDLERMDMMREERLMRLHIKKISRTMAEAAVAQELTNSKRAARHEPHPDELIEDESDPESDCVVSPKPDTHATVARKAARMHAIELAHLQRLQKVSQSTAVPVASKRGSSKPRRKHSGAAFKKTRALRAVYGGGGYNTWSNNQANSQTYDRTAKPKSDDSELVLQYAGWDFHNDGHAELVEDEAEFDYGNDFDDDVADETQLTRLLC